MNDDELRDWLAQAGFPAEDPISPRLASGVTPLMHAAQTGNIDAMSALLARDADPALLNADGNGALWLACYADSTECAAALIAAGAPIDNQNVNGATALIYCASAGKTPLVKLLLEAGANAELMTHDDFTALELASNVDCLRLLRTAWKAAHV